MVFDPFSLDVAHRHPEKAIFSPAAFGGGYPGPAKEHRRSFNFSRRAPSSTESQRVCVYDSSRDGIAIVYSDDASQCSNHLQSTTVLMQDRLTVVDSYTVAV